MKQSLVAVSIVVRDYDEAISYYTEILGFELLEDTPQGGGKRWVMVRPPGSVGQLLLARAKNDDEAKCVGRQTGGRVFLFLHTDDFDRDYARMKALGVKFCAEPRQEAYGKVVVFQDLYGNKWDFIEPAKTSAARGGRTAEPLISELQMERVPHEGIWFAPADGRSGSFSSIHAVATVRDFSALHRLAKDEIWHFQGGDPAEMLLLHPDGRGEIVVLGPDVAAGQRPQVLVPRGVWQGARPLGEGDASYTFFGATVIPAFDYADYEPGRRKELQAQYPAFADRIALLTRDS